LRRPGRAYGGPHPYLLFCDGQSGVEQIPALIARVIGWFEPRPDLGPGHPPAETARALVAPLIPLAKRGGTKRMVDVREIVNGIMHVLGTGCQ
jgi:hypothetical protein